MRRLSSILITFYLTAITISVASAQILPRPASVDSVVVDGIVADTTAADTTVVGSDGLPSADAFTTDVDTIAAPVDGPVTATGSGSTAGTRSVRFAAADSLVIVLDADDGDVANLVGDARVTYRDVTLEAHEVDLYFDRDLLRARGLESDTSIVGRPHFQQGSESFSGDRLAFNMRTERGRIEAAQTAIQEGFVRAGAVTVAEDSTLYISRGVYTTCDCVEDPSYSLRSDRMKIEDGEWIYTGPIQLYLFNIPTPLWLPFGFLPATEGRRSGPLAPRYGEDERGFYLQDWGWYWAISDYMDLQVQGGIWTRGSWSVAPLYRYNKRNAYSGSLRFHFVRNRSGERRDPDFQIYDTASLQWTHNQTINPTATLSGNVNLTSSSYARSISESYDDRVRQNVSSTVRYAKRWPNAGRSMNISLTQSQNLTTGNANLTLPSMSFSQNSVKPFQRSRGLARDNFFERITLSYSGRLDNRFDYTPLPDTMLEQRGIPDVQWYDALFSPSTYRSATDDETPFDLSATHNIPISSNFSIVGLPLISPGFRFNVTTSANYTESWHTQTQRRQYDEDANRVITEQVPGFFALRRFSLSASGNTAFYGTFPVQIGAFRGLRHTVRPSLSYSYSPDFTRDFWGYTRSYIDAQGNEVEYPIIGGVSSAQQALSFQISNVFETKRIRLADDGEETEQTLKLLDLNVSSSYNFAADSLRLAPVNVNARTRLFDQFDIRWTATYSPYITNPATGRDIGSYLFSTRPWMPLRLVRTSLNLSTAFRSSPTGAARPFEAGRARPGDPMTPQGPMTPGGTPATPLDPLSMPYSMSTGGYADFAIPWSLNLDFNFSHTRSGLQTNRTAIVNASFDFNLTPNWKVQGRTGYDLVRDDIVLTNLNIMRDFECWQLSAHWTPFGPYQSWGFDLRVKSGHLRDILRLRQPRQDVRGRFGGRLN